jgi:hypothetical protein
LFDESWTVAPQVLSEAVVTDEISIGSSKANLIDVPIDTPVLPLLGTTALETTFGLELSISTTGSGSGTGLAFSLVSSDEQATTIAPKSMVRMSGLRVYFCKFISVSLIKKI